MSEVSFNQIEGLESDRSSFERRTKEEYGRYETFEEIPKMRVSGQESFLYNGERVAEGTKIAVIGDPGEIYLVDHTTIIIATKEKEIYVTPFSLKTKNTLTDLGYKEDLGGAIRASGPAGSLSNESGVLYSFADEAKQAEWLEVYREAREAEHSPQDQE